MEYSSTKKIRLPGISTLIDDSFSSDESSHEYREEVTPSRYGYDGFQRFGLAAEPATTTADRSNIENIHSNLKDRFVPREHHHDATPLKPKSTTKPPKSSTKSKASRRSTFSPTSSALNSVLHATAEAIVADSTSRRSMGERIVDRLDDFAEFVMGSVPSQEEICVGQDGGLEREIDTEVETKNERETDLESCDLSAVEVVEEDDLATQSFVEDGAEQTIDESSTQSHKSPETTSPQTNESYESEESFFYIGAGEEGFCPSHSIHDSDISETDDEFLDDDISFDDQENTFDDDDEEEMDPGDKVVNISILTEYVDENGGVEVERSSFTQMALDTSILTEIVAEEEKKDDSVDIVGSCCVDEVTEPNGSLQSDTKAVGAYHCTLTNEAYHRSTTVDSSSPLSTPDALEISPRTTPHSPSAGDEFVSSSFKNFVSRQENNLTSLLSSIEGLAATPGRIKTAVQNGMYEEDDMNMDSGLGLTPLKSELANFDLNVERGGRGRLLASHQKEGIEHRKGVLFPSPLAETAVLKTVGEEGEHRGAVLFQSPPAVEDAVLSNSSNFEKQLRESCESMSENYDLETSMDDSPISKEHVSSDLDTGLELKSDGPGDVNIGLPQSPLPQEIRKDEEPMVQNNQSPKQSPLELKAVDFSTRSAELMDYLRQSIEKSPNSANSSAANQEPLALSPSKDLSAADETQLLHEPASIPHSSDNAQQIDVDQNDEDEIPASLREIFANAESVLQKELASPSLKATNAIDTDGMGTFCDDYIKPTSNAKPCNPNRNPSSSHLPFASPTDCIPIDTANLNKTNYLEGETTGINLESLKEVFLKAESQLESAASPIIKGQQNSDDDLNDQNSAADTTFETANFSMSELAAAVDDFFDAKEELVDQARDEDKVSDSKLVVGEAESIRDASDPGANDFAGEEQLVSVQHENERPDPKLVAEAEKSMESISQSNEHDFTGQNEPFSCADGDSIDTNNSPDSDSNIDITQSIRDASDPGANDFAGKEQLVSVQHENERPDPEPVAEAEKSMESISQSNEHDFTGQNEPFSCADGDSTDTNRSPDSDSNIDITQTLDRVGEYLKRMTVKEPEFKAEGNNDVSVDGFESYEIPESELPVESNADLLTHEFIKELATDALSTYHGMELVVVPEPEVAVESEITDLGQKKIAQLTVQEDDIVSRVNGLKSEQESEPDMPIKKLEGNVADFSEVTQPGTKGEDLKSNERPGARASAESEEKADGQTKVNELPSERDLPVEDMVSDEVHETLVEDGNNSSNRIDMSISSVEKSSSDKEVSMTAKEDSQSSHSPVMFNPETIVTSSIVDDPDAVVKTDWMADTSTPESSSQSDEMNESMFIPNNSMEIVSIASPAPVVPFEPTSESSDDNSDEDFFPNRNLATSKTTSKLVASTRSKENVANESTESSAVTFRSRSLSTGRAINEKASLASVASRRSVPSMRKVSSKSNISQPKFGKKTMIPATTLSRRARQNSRTPPKSPPSHIKPAKKRTKLSTITNTVDSPKRVGAKLKSKAMVQSASVHSKSSASRASSATRPCLPSKIATKSESKLVGASPRSSSMRRSLIVVAKNQRDSNSSRPRPSQQRSNLSRSERLAQLAKPRSVVKKPTTPPRKTSMKKKLVSSRPPSFLKRESKRSLLKSTSEREVDDLSSVKPFKASKIRGSNATVKSRYNNTHAPKQMPSDKSHAKPFKSLREEIDNYNFRQMPAAIATPVDPNKFSTPSFLDREINRKASKHTIATLGESITKYNFRATPNTKTPINSKAAPPSFLCRPFMSHNLPKSSEELELEECKNKFKACPLPVSSVSKSRAVSRPREGRSLTTPRPPKLHTSARPGMKTPILTQDEIELKKQFHARPLPVSLYGSSFATPARYYGKTPQPDADEIELNKKFHALPLPEEIYGKTVNNNGTPFHIRSEQQYQNAMERKKQIIEEEIEQLKMCRERKATPLPSTNREAKPIVIKKCNKGLVQPRPPRLSLDVRSLERKQFDDNVKQIRDSEAAAEAARIEAEVKAQEEEIRRRRSLTIEEGGLCFRARSVNIRYE